MGDFCAIAVNLRRLSQTIIVEQLWTLSTIVDPCPQLWKLGQKDLVKNGQRRAVGGVLAKGSKRIVDFVHNLWTIVDHRGTILWTFAQLWTTYFS